MKKKAKSSHARLPTACSCWDQNREKWQTNGSNQQVQLQFELTIDCDSNSLRQDEAILANKGRDFSETVSRLVLGSDIARVGLNDLQLKVVGLCNRLDGGGAGVALQKHNRNVSMCMEMKPARSMKKCNQLTSKV